MKRLLVAAMLVSAALQAQAVEHDGISPVRLYNGIHRAFPVLVTAPAAAKRIEIALLAPATADTVATAAATAGKNDLAQLFPILWSTNAPRLLYAQLIVDGQKLGSALVLQPMTNPLVSRLGADGKTVEFVADDDQAYAGIRAYSDRHLVFDTSLGTMEFRLRPDCAPNTAYNVMEFVRGGIYTDTIWHRVVAKRADGSPFVIQGGDPAGTGEGGPGFAYPLEKSTLPHDFGVLSIARGTDPNTNGCQVFVCLSRQGTKHLDGLYAAFGELVKGADVVLKIAAVPVGQNERPLNPPKIRRAYLVEAPPYGTGPEPVKR